MNVPMTMSDTVFNSPLIPTLYGTPPQLINTTLDLNTDKMAVYSSRCILCSGNTSFDPTLSTTFQVPSILHVNHDYRIQHSDTG